MDGITWLISQFSSSQGIVAVIPESNPVISKFPLKSALERGRGGLGIILNEVHALFKIVPNRRAPLRKSLFSSSIER